ncbi:hypothetical protein Hanom_Chr03g00237861 [Helianthus anomalus]
MRLHISVDNFVRSDNGNFIHCTEARKTLETEMETHTYYTDCNYTAKADGQRVYRLCQPSRSYPMGTFISKILCLSKREHATLNDKHRLCNL